MTSDELRAAREQRWTEAAADGLMDETLRAFIEDIGLAPITAVANVPLPALDSLARDSARSFENLRAALENQIAARKVLETDLWPGSHFYVSAELLPFLYVQAGDRHPERDYVAQLKAGKLSRLASEVYSALLRESRPLTTAELWALHGRSTISALAIERALAELAKTWKVFRSGRKGDEPLWEALIRAFPEITLDFDRFGKVEAAGALIAKFLGAALLATEEEIAHFFSPVFSVARSHSALLGLEAAKEIMVDSVDGRPAWRLVHGPIVLAS